MLAYYTYYFGPDNNYNNVIPKIPSTVNDCYYFTNNKNTFSKLGLHGWIPIFIDLDISHDPIINCMNIKDLKTRPHLNPYLKKYTYVCHMDSKLDFVNDNIVYNIIHNQLKNKCMVFRLHPFAKSVQKEYEAAMEQGRYRAQKPKVDKYIQTMLDYGFTDNYDEPHLACGFIVYDMTNPKTSHIGNAWFNHIQMCGIEDQISFYFVKQLFKGLIGNCPWDLSSS